MGQDVEVILLKQLASCLRMPIALVAPDGQLAYFNEPAESIFGVRFEETGSLPADEWHDLIQPSDEHHVPLKREERPLMVALDRRTPAHRRMQVHTGGRWREVEVTGLPLAFEGDRFLGALSLFWEPGQRHATGIDSEPVDEESAPTQLAVETILTRRIAATWTAPVFLVDAAGRLLYFNHAAAPILGEQFPKLSKPLRREALYDAFSPRDADKRPLAPDEHPLQIARTRREPAHGVTWIRSLDGSDRRIAVTAIPLVGQSDRLVGVVGIFWEQPS